MQSIINSLQQAEAEFTKADYLISKTYHMLQETKLLLTAINGLSRSANHLQNAVLEYERLYKRINPIKRDVESEKIKFKNIMIKRYKVQPELLTYIDEINEIIKRHKESPMAFTRKDKFIICSDNYRMKTIDLRKVKIFLQMHRKLLENATRICRRR